MQLSASRRSGVVDARLRGHDVAVRLIAVFLLASILGPPSAMAQDRSDGMLRAFQDACFPHLNDPAARRQKIVGAGFAQVPVDEVPEIKLMTRLPEAISKFLGIPESHQASLPSVEYETYRGQREGFDLVVVLQATVSHGERHSQCVVYDFGAVEPVSDKKVAEWIGRSADKQIRDIGSIKFRSGWRWASRVGALPGGYHGISSVYQTATRGIPWSGASLNAAAPPSREPAGK